VEKVSDIMKIGNNNLLAYILICMFSTQI